MLLMIMKMEVMPTLILSDRCLNRSSYFTLDHFSPFQQHCVIGVHFVLPQGEGPTAVVIFLKRKEEIRKSVGDLLKLLTLRLEIDRKKNPTITFLF